MPDPVNKLEPADLDQVVGGNKTGDAVHSLLELLSGAPRPEIKRPDPFPQEQVDPRPPPELPGGVKPKQR